MNGNNTSVKLLIALNYMYYAFYKGGGVGGLEDVIHCNQYSDLKKRKKRINQIMSVNIPLPMWNNKNFGMNLLNNNS